MTSTEPAPPKTSTTSVRVEEDVLGTRQEQADYMRDQAMRYLSRCLIVATAKLSDTFS